jgi:DNA-directed RNA polymerase subunit RPC12/RpoP
MKSYKCQSCEFIFSDADKVLDITAPAGKCPKCPHSLPDYSSELYSHKIQYEPEVQKIEFGENANAFRCFNCSSITFNKDAGHIPFIAVLGLNGILKYFLSLFFGGVFNNKKTVNYVYLKAP